MPRIDILAELKSAIQTNDVLNLAIAAFLLDMQGPWNGAIGALKI